MAQLGYGDLSPYGHPTSNTPNIQQLADEGLLFTQFYSTSPVGSGARASLLTGRYQIRSGVYPGAFTPDDLGGEVGGEGGRVGGTVDHRTTFAASTKLHGYMCFFNTVTPLGYTKQNHSPPPFSCPPSLLPPLPSPLSCFPPLSTMLNV